MGIVLKTVLVITSFWFSDAFHRSEKPWLCSYPCACRVKELNCGEGISMVKDGCGCCFMCARQHGDICNVKDVCESKQDLYCDMTRPHGPGTGICRAKSSKPCIVNGATYDDGQKFKPDCSRLCTCQNGNYGCVDLCPDEYRVPSQKHCRQPKLMTVTGQCCKQWTCGVTEQRKDSEASIKPRHLMGSYRQSMELRAATSSRHGKTAPRAEYMKAKPHCPRNNSAWTHCSADCGIGVSTRKFKDNNCQPKEETRLCYIRPCNVTVAPKDKNRCTPTTRLQRKQRVRYEDCLSVHEMNFKFCTNCKKKRCCYPRKEKTRHVEFECGDGRRQLFAFMWIKSCQCDKKCYQKDTNARYSKRYI